MQLDLERSVIRSWRDDDCAAIVRHADNRNVWINLYDVFPHPYTAEDARAWVARCREADPRTHFAIEVDGEAVGGIGLTLGEGNRRRTAAIGYWLGEAYWGRGIVSEAVPAVTEWGFATFDLCRIHAGVFAWNPASMRVLEKAGYVREARMRRAVVKDGKTIDELLYARVLDV